MKSKTVWDDISTVWKRIAAVIAAVGVCSTLIVKVFNAPPEPTYAIFSGFGTVLLITSFYVDRQTRYIYLEMTKCENQARKDFTSVIEETQETIRKANEAAEYRVSRFEERVNKITELTEETRKDTLRIQLVLLMQNQPSNVDTILKLAEKYFVELQGDWYMTNEFNRWAKEHNVIVPQYIHEAIKETHKRRD